ncbi:MAG TPA: M90 family metallopeptidase [Polyangiaceae bacterium]|jgi:hypothetical protein|nr:M90 family metallopeptidase [Polyangiaceae bacterium]
MFPLSKRARRDKIRAQAMPDAWRTIIDANVPYAAHLSQTDRHELDALVRIFLAEKRFEGCGGLSVTDEMRVTIAAQACLLLLHRETDIYPDLEAILIYPHPYRAPADHGVGPLRVHSDEARLGESWTRDLVVLAWDHVNAATHAAVEGHSLVLHEFAHQLDGEDGAMDGAPGLGSRNRYAAWARVFAEEYEDLSRRFRAGLPSDLDPYGSTNPAEFFAVVTEMFFEQPGRLKRRHPALYAELESFYRQDPAGQPARSP